MKKVLAITKKLMYNDFCCGMIAMKREVAAQEAGVPWSECQVRKLTTSHCTHNMVCVKQKQRVRIFRTHTEKCTVTACRTEFKVRKGGDFFYGKSSNENHSQGL